MRKLINIVNEAEKPITVATESRQSLNGSINSSYSLYLNNDDYQTLRKASMQGKFPFKFSREIDGDTTIFTKNPNKMARALDNIIDFGATSPWDVLDINSFTNKKF